MITINNNMYVLDTDNTSYAFAVLGSGQFVSWRADIRSICIMEESYTPMRL